MDSTFSLRRLAVTSLLSASAVLAQNPVDAITTCLDAAGVRNVISTDAEWPSAITQFQRRLGPAAPVAVSFPETEDHVAAALSCARASSVKVSTLGGANSFQGFGFGNPGNLIVNMAAFTSVEFDECKNTVTYGGGIRVGPLMKNIWDNHGTHIPHVRGSVVGVTGSSIGGGFGSTSRHLGTPMDNILAVKYMLYNGTVVTATEGSDLLWAAKGAGSSFGVILSVTSQTHKPAFDSATNFTFNLGRLSTDVAAEALLAVQDFALEEGSPDELALRWSLTGTGTTGTGYYYGDPAAFDEAIAPLVSRWEMITNTTVTIPRTVLPFWAMEVAIAGAGMELPLGGNPASRASYTQSVVTTADKPLSFEQTRTLIDSITFGFNRTDMSRSGFLDLWGGVSRDIKDSDTAFAHGNNLWLIRVDGNSNSGDNGFPADGLTYMKSLTRPFEASLESAGVALRAFPNYIDTELTQAEWSQKLFGANFGRLQEIKVQVDPEAVFTSHRQSIPLP
jgi:FAD/FMN-containing dehydrogenase